MAPLWSWGAKVEVRTCAVGVVGDTLITYGAVHGFAALVIEDTEYPITPHSVHRVPKGAVHAVIGDAVREVVNALRAGRFFLFEVAERLGRQTEKRHL